MYSQQADVNRTCFPRSPITEVLGLLHRRRIKTEEKAKVVAAVCGEEFIKFLAALAVLNYRMNCTRMI